MELEPLYAVICTAFVAKFSHKVYRVCMTSWTYTILKNSYWITIILKDDGRKSFKIKFLFTKIIENS